MAVGNRDNRRAGAQPPQQPLGDTGPSGHQRIAPFAMQPVGRGDRQEPGPGHVFANRLVSAERLRRDRAAISDRQLGIGPRLAQPVAAGDNAIGEFRGKIALGLLDRPCREAEIDRLAVLALNLLESPAQQAG